MSERIKEMMVEIEDLRQKLKEEIEQQEKKIDYEIKNGYIRFEDEVLSKQKENMKHLLAWFGETPFIQLLSAPIVYGMVLPALLLDLMLFVYTYVVGRVFKITFVQRKDYIVFDRQYLGYLNIVEKLNCLYCAYFNGLMQYSAAIAGRTELYFCPIKHAKKIAYDHNYYDAFFAYGDGEKYPQKLEKLREEVQEVSS
ncbi:hypothetical protein [Sulfurovum riftiae]|uniref:Uncharacterized protein n=1 Tax=Sulfurovum riftiae TaxID=1630136 RepID=A0A151CED8_9BACT|nr:hypothetical protein [Sulfurovum riftiae]KYJ85885.1 hypothetical protein AS592_04650 [Sulfurovum riftiae]